MQPKSYSIFYPYGFVCETLFVLLTSLQSSKVIYHGAKCSSIQNTFEMDLNRLLMAKRLRSFEKQNNSSDRENTNKLRVSNLTVETYFLVFGRSTVTFIPGATAHFSVVRLSFSRVRAMSRRFWRRTLSLIRDKTSLSSESLASSSI